MNKIIQDEINNFVTERINKQRIANHNRLNELFSGDLNEGDDNVRQEVIILIKNNDWDEQNPKAFRESLSKSKHLMMLTDYTESELSQMKLFKLNGFNIGYALKNHEGKPYSEIVAVHNNEPNVRGIGDILMKSAISNGGCYLDHFDSEKLSSLYNGMGFIEYSREPYNPEYDRQGEFKNAYGELDVIFRKHRNCN